MRDGMGGEGNFPLAENEQHPPIGCNCYQSLSSIIIWPTGDKHDDCGLLIRIEPVISQQGRPWGGSFIAKACKI